MAKQYSKTAQTKSYGGGDGSIALGANLETLRYQNEAALRSPHEDDAALFEDIGNSVSAPGQRPRGLGANLAAGVSKGLAYGSKTKATEEKKGRYDKYANVMNYLQEQNTASLEQKQWYESRENAKKEMIPQVLSYIDNIDRLDPQSQRIMAQDMLAQYGEAIGEDFKLSSIDGSNPFLMTIQGSKGQQLFDLRSIFAGEQATQQAIANKMPEYQMKLQEDRTNKQREFDQKQDALDVKKYEKGLPNKYGTAEPAQFGSIPIKALGGKGMTPFMQTINAEINLAKDVPIIMHQLSEAERILKDNPSVGNAWNNYMVTGNSSKGLSMTGSARTAYEELDKIVNRVAEAYIKAKAGAISESEREIIKKGLFSVTNNQESNKYNINSIRQELEIAKERGNFAAKELAKGYIATAGSFDEYRNSKSQSGDAKAESPLAAFGKRIN
jgi:hypothetical protein